MREMISDKVRAVPPSVIRAMFDKAAAMEGVISLGIGEPDFDTPAEVCEKALADTLASNYPHIRQVRILIEGAEVESLKGHVDLRRPVPADFSLVRRQGTGAAPGEPAPGTIIEEEVKEGGR